MGKKGKTGKQRRDKYYHLAKETGLRARSAFKLIQLNRKYNFLQRSKVLIDLCAAPGGWLQVAQQNMPVSSLIIGVDLVSIKPMGNNVMTLQEDITTESCKRALDGQLHQAQVDVVLHDGAPNVGKNWLHDAFSQAQLALSALKLATGYLRKGGWFVSKVFRSKDHPALLAVFAKLFKKVHVTKPQASRNESAEIFVTCEGYRKPPKVDPHLLDPKAVFKELQLEPETQKVNVLHPEKTKKKAEGYLEGDYTVYHDLNATDLIRAENFLELLSRANEVVIDDPVIEALPATTPELRQCLKDIQVLGRRELKIVINWRKAAIKALAEPVKKTSDENDESGEIVREEQDPEEAIENELNAAMTEEKRHEKKAKRKEQKKKSELKRKIDLEMVIPGDDPDLGIQDMELFNLTAIKRKRDLGVLPAQATNSQEDSEGEIDEVELSDMESEDGSLPDVQGRGVDKEARRKKRTDLWFQRDAFGEIDSDDGLEGPSGAPTEEKMEVEEEATSAPSGSGVKIQVPGPKVAPTEKPAFDQDAENQPPSKQTRLNAEGLAMGSLLIRSTKTRRDLIEEGWNKYTFNDDNLPDWFVEDEKRHFRKPLPLPTDLVSKYSAKAKAIDARPIKRVAEAKLRKRLRAQRKAEKMRKKADVVADDPEMGEHEKAKELKRIYKNATTTKKKEKKYLVAKKGKAMGKPKGPFKMVDPRLKKDTRARVNADKKAGKKKGAKPQFRGGKGKAGGGRKKR